MKSGLKPKLSAKVYIFIYKPRHACLYLTGFCVSLNARKTENGFDFIYNDLIKNGVCL